MSRIAFIVIAGVLLIALAACLNQQEPSDAQLEDLLQAHGVSQLDPGPVQDQDLVALGQALYFDKILSGNGDISCATCHHPAENTGDGIPVSIGTGGTGLGVLRTIGYGRNFIPRNAPEVFNRGAPEWKSMFWDSRVAMQPDGTLQTPAGDLLPSEMDNVLAAQAMFPVTSADEMRGVRGDETVWHESNELALIDDKDLPAVWEALMDRLLAYPGYVELFQAAFPDLPREELGFQQAAQAIAAFEIDAYSLYDTPWDRYLGGEMNALPEDAKQGALLFYGQAQCGSCHSGPLLTDQSHHNLAVPQVGPGKGDEAPLDMGRFRETDVLDDKYCFRTPPLRNVTFTGPWMHDGAFSSLEAVIRHHIDPVSSLQSYDPALHLPPELQDTFQADEALRNDMLRQLDPQLLKIPPLSDQEIAYLLAFLEALGDKAIYDLERVVPDTVPSGLVVAD